MWSGHQEGSFGLGEEDRAALAHNREALSGMDLDSDAVLGGRIRATLGRIDELLGDSVDLVRARLSGLCNPARNH